MKFKIRLDTQTKLLLLLFANTLVFFHLPLGQELLSVIFLLVIIFLSGSYRRGIVYSLIYTSCLVLDNLLLSHYNGFFIPLLSFYASTFRHLMPLFMMGGFFMATTKVSSLIYTLRKWHLPEFIVIPFSVLFRFFPTLKVDYRHIRSAMKLRGIAVTNFDMIKHPIQMLEYIVVPILMSASITAIDLSAAALTRGITNPGNHTTITDSGLAVTDYLVIATAIIITIIRGL